MKAMMGNNTMTGLIGLCLLSSVLTAAENQPVAAKCELAVEMRALLDESGFKDAESLCTEWRPMLEDFNKVSWKQNTPAGSVRAAFAR